jgi:hypothetical protein
MTAPLFINGEPLKVKHTKFMWLRPGDILMHRAGDLLWPDWDVLGNLIAGLEGNTGTDRDPKAPGYSKGDYTHCGWLRDMPDPEAEVEELSDRPGVFKIKDGNTWCRIEKVPGRWAESPVEDICRLTSKMPIRVHATWPEVKEETIDLENKHMEIWRMRRVTPEIIAGVLKLANDMIGWKYDIADFLSFGNLHLPGAKICSEFISDIAYNTSLLLGKEYPICLTPDISGNADKQKAPNDLINSGELIKIDFQGLLPQYLPA